jgi:integrase
MRSGEILGLMHHDISENTISIKRSISKGRITTPKTHGSIRTIPMFEKVRPFIEGQLKQSKSLYLFDHEGHYISDISVFRKRKWHKLLKSWG